MKIKFIATIAMLFIATSCAVSLEKMKQETENYKLPFKPKKDGAIIYVIRPSKLGGFIKFNVFLDDKNQDSEMGYNLGSQHIYFLVNPGKYKIFSKAENWAELEVEVKVGDNVFIKQSAYPGFIMARNSLEILSETEGKFYLKNSVNGTIKKLERKDDQNIQ